jgi:multisubunit Na+/H+ antiporter MnhG subunit
MAIVLISLLVLYFRSRHAALLVPIGLLVLTMAAPTAFRFLVRVWFGVSRLIGAVVSKVILTVLFFLVVTPVGLIRRMCGADPLKLNEWKRGMSSVLSEREGVVAPDHLKTPY